MSYAMPSKVECENCGAVFLDETNGQRHTCSHSCAAIIRQKKKMKPVTTFIKQDEIDPTNLPSDALLTATQAAHFLGRTTQTLNNWRFTRKGPVFRKYDDASVRYVKKDLENFLEKQKAGQERRGNKNSLADKAESCLRIAAKRVNSALPQQAAATKAPIIAAFMTCMVLHDLIEALGREDETS